MGYKLEESGSGAFVDRICYLYKEGRSKGIAARENTKRTWHYIRKEARQRRLNRNIKPYPIVEIRP